MGSVTFHAAVTIDSTSRSARRPVSGEVNGNANAAAHPPAAIAATT
jgi:hypothetical protein